MEGTVEDGMEGCAREFMGGGIGRLQTGHDKNGLASGMALMAPRATRGMGNGFR